jgi:hypothetical protein
MSSLEIQTRDGKTRFRPGEEITGTVSWALDKAPTSVELRLFWYTQGKGTTDFGVTEIVPFPAAAQTDRRDFSALLPAMPYSFSGKLISLIWALELIAQPGKQSTRLDLIMSPTGEEITLQPS